MFGKLKSRIAQPRPWGEFKSSASVKIAFNSGLKSFQFKKSNLCNFFCFIFSRIAEQRLNVTFGKVLKNAILFFISYFIAYFAISNIKRIIANTRVKKYQSQTVFNQPRQQSADGSQLLVFASAFKNTVVGFSIFLVCCKAFF